MRLEQLPLRRRILKLVLWGFGYLVILAIPGAIIGFVTGFFSYHRIAAVAGGVLFFILYPASRRKWGPGLDDITLLMAFCGSIGVGLSCYIVGSLTG
ncbi:MAG TPA: hypothetical protein G4O20_05315 [Dehalococcoidia bacterium]|nr:hypothetical protein [Dehalococcoidia bacterium]